LTSIGVGIAFEVPDHVLQQLHELDLSFGGRFGELLAELVDDVVRPSASRARP